MIATKHDISDQLIENISRVKNLVRIYETYLAGELGSRAHLKTDVLRAATVLLHATLEDFLRNLAYWKLPHSGASVLDQFPLVGNAPTQKFSLGNLAKLRGMSVDQVINDSVDAYLERSNYNNTREVARLLNQISLNATLVESTFSDLEELMKRRHQIVHRADIDAKNGSQNHKVRSIGVSTVNRWIANVEVFTSALLAQC